MDADTFVNNNNVVKTRNYYTHYSNKKCVLQGGQLHWAAHKLNIMLRVLLLTEMGVPESELQLAFSKNLRLSGQRKEWLSISEKGTLSEQVVSGKATESTDEPL
ncbi:hypothetical protein Fuma_01198 [Fuerstiella marisgermanici]|uniref:Apea-like HEPN domain-containing protein n=1 Tax=Fuerstiella marisgermanici TaxID=1891926 RepID=A0A1P8WC14_9PLAN|nr:hypothetical protein Fuma_01198 [Fuerstiella marisgermanici]